MMADMCIKLFGADQCFGSEVHELVHWRYKSFGEMALGLLYGVFRRIHGQMGGLASVLF
jgi:hypothetical protein